MGRRLLILLAFSVAAVAAIRGAPEAERGPDVYFHNRVTSEVSWDPPSALAAYVHAPSGRFYWDDPATGGTTWEVRTVMSHTCCQVLKTLYAAMRGLYAAMRGLYAAMRGLRPQRPRACGGLFFFKSGFAATKCSLFII